MSIVKRIGCIAASLAGFLIVFDLIGVAACFFGDILFSRSWSAGAIYAIWFVLGVFLGLMHYGLSLDLCDPKSGRNGSTLVDAGSTGALVIWVSTVILCGLSFFFYRFWWRRGVGSPDGYVPDSMSATITFFTTIIATMWMASSTSRSDQPSNKRKPS